MGQLGKWLERKAEPKRTRGLGTHALDDNDFAKSSHKEKNQTERFDCISLGNRTEKEPQGLDAGRNFGCNKQTQRTRKSQWQVFQVLTTN